ncbi:hypothetical protein GCM10010300_52210 [Streptomyces olivaceoviridis]|uniref:hypothetical protein n=1 Tax=Streptomyces olivaceoviridis TaxID=1921 RepID=UPI0016736E72|nr:hypothetical protein [Streptomyces olivaceoviridis]GGZ01740.1 hypothetical protein GCM10010300_52210 [Streptomyces olivaceoviridis]
MEHSRDLVVTTGADGVKLGFLERFATPVPDDPSPHSPVAATVRLLAETTDAVREAGRRPLIEFREPYVHAVVDLRMARPGTPIHSETSSGSTTRCR